MLQLLADLYVSTRSSGTYILNLLPQSANQFVPFKAPTDDPVINKAFKALHEEKQPL